MSIHFKLKNIYKGTWTTPNGQYVNQTDHIILIATEKKKQKE